MSPAAPARRARGDGLGYEVHVAVLRRAAAQAGVQDLPGVGARRDEGVITQLVGVAVGGADFGRPGHLADRGIHVDGHRICAGTPTGRPRPSERRAGGLVELADVTPRGRRAGTTRPSTAPPARTPTPHRSRRRAGDPRDRYGWRPPTSPPPTSPPFRPGAAPPARRPKRTDASTNDTKPSRPINVAAATKPASATNDSSSKTTPNRSMLCDTPPTGSASSSGSQPLSLTAILPGQRGTSAHLHPQTHTPIGGSRLRTS